MSADRLLTDRIATTEGIAAPARKIGDRIYATLYDDVATGDTVIYRDEPYRVLAVGRSWDRVTILTVASILAEQGALTIDGVRYYQTSGYWVFADDGGWMPGSARTLDEALALAKAYQADPLAAQAAWDARVQSGEFNTARSNT